MIWPSPPGWLQRSLLLFLDARDCETVCGDLLEEYREEQLQHAGSLRANYWYLRQVLSFASIRLVRGPLLKQVLVLMCLFAMAAGTWLGVMENILKHGGYRGRSVIAACIALQGLATLLFILINGRVVFRVVVVTGAAAIVLLGGSAILRLLQAQHFEGFVFIIALALILQGCFTLMALLRRRSGNPA